MSLIIQPKRWSIKPGPGVAIQAGHPMAAGLTSCILFNQGIVNALDLIRVESLAVVSPPLSEAATTMGKAVNNSASAYLSESVVRTPMPLSGSAGPWSVLFGWQTNSTTQTNTYLYEENGTGVQTSIIYGYVAHSVEFFVAGASGSNPRTGSQISVNNTNLHLVGYTYKGQSGEWALWLDGLKTVINSSISFTLGSSNSGPSRTILNTVGGGAPHSGSFLFWYMWNRYVDLGSFSVDPWQFLQPQSPQRRYWVAPSVITESLEWNTHPIFEDVVTL